jgi:hypothetical protein
VKIADFNVVFPFNLWKEAVISMYEWPARRSALYRCGMGEFLHSGDIGAKLMPNGSDRERVKREKLVSFLVLVAILLLLFMQFGPSAIFGTETEGDHHMSDGGHDSIEVGLRTSGKSL